MARSDPVFLRGQMMAGATMKYWTIFARLLLAAATILSAFPAPACYNWANVLPSDARDPRNPRAGRGDPDKDCIWGTGTIIQCSSQTLAETAPLTGTPFALR